MWFFHTRTLSESTVMFVDPQIDHITILLYTIVITQIGMSAMDKHSRCVGEPRWHRKNCEKKR